MLVWCWDTRSMICSSTCGQMEFRRGSAAAEPSNSCCGAPSSDMSSTGTTTLISTVFSDGGFTTVTGRLPPRKDAIASMGRTVADRPIRWAGVGSSASRRSRESARCAPRFDPAMAWISSMITVCTPARDDLAEEVRIRNRDSGVVMKMSGGAVLNRRRSAALVSPERTPTRISSGSRPMRSLSREIPANGERRLRSTSTPSAFSGEM